MDKSALIDAALDKLIGDMDDMEGKGAMAHSLDECSDPLTCGMHDGELGDNLSPATAGEPAAVKIEVSHLGGNKGMPSLDGVTEGGEKGADEELSPEEADMLKKLLR